jgi:ABC-2 type transport system ATP-binding protein
MRQKVLLIGIIHNPKIIILDEPLSGLGCNAVIMVKELILLGLKEGKVTFYCLHMMDVVEKSIRQNLNHQQRRNYSDGSLKNKSRRRSNLYVFSKPTGKEESNKEAADVF